MLDCRTELHYITAPYGAMSVFGQVPNAIMFPLRHSYLLSTVGHENIGDLEWFIVKSLFGTGPIAMGDSSSLLREQGIFQNGVDTVGLKTPPRKWGIDVAILGKGNEEESIRLSFNKARVMLGAILSPDSATVLLQDNENILPSSSDQPNPWTYTWVRQDGVRFHCDFAIGYPEQATDTYDPAYNQWNTRIFFESDEPYFYSDLIEEEFSTLLIGSNDFFELPILYTGSFRAPFRLEFSIWGQGTGLLAGIEMRDVSLPGIIQSRPFQYSRYRTNGEGWPFASTTGAFTYDFDTDRKVLVTPYGQDLSKSADPRDMTDWEAFQFAPNRRYNFRAITVGDDSIVRIVAKLSYRKRYIAI